jgi:DNA-directed RNA polymerase beta' subunit
VLQPSKHWTKQIFRSRIAKNHIFRHYNRDLSFIATFKMVHRSSTRDIFRQSFLGDFSLFNRQPSLRKKSFLGLQAKIVPHLTFRFNLSLCTPYNADFDGDEMNVHVPQSIQATAEAKELMSIEAQLLNAQNSKPVCGIVQDALLGAHYLSQPHTLFNKAQFAQLMMTIPNLYEFPIPAFLKPEPLWTGRQALSLVFPDFNYTNGEVVIWRGELLSGVLTKEHLGAVSGGIIHVISKLYSPARALDFMNSIQLLCNSYLETQGISAGLSDCRPDAESRRKIDHLIDKCVDRVQEIETMAKELGVPAARREAQVSGLLGKMLGVAGGILQKTPDRQTNALKMMIAAGSKGNVMNLAQISGLSGQQSLEGKRIANMYRPDDRVLPYFEHSSTDPAARGFVRNSFVQGLTMTQMFFHTISGHEGIVDTGVKTADTGYLQRKMVTATEAISIHYDSLQRDAYGNLMDLTYSGDNMDSAYLEKVNMNFLKQKESKVKENLFDKPHFNFLKLASDVIFSSQEQILFDELRTQTSEIKSSPDVIEFLLVYLSNAVQEHLPNQPTEMELKENAVHQDLLKLLEEVSSEKWCSTLYLRLSLIFHLRWQAIQTISHTSWNNILAEIRRKWQQSSIQVHMNLFKERSGKVTFTPVEQLLYDKLEAETLEAKLSITHQNLEVVAHLPVHLPNLLLQHAHKHVKEIELKEDEVHQQLLELLKELLNDGKFTQTLYLRISLVFHLRWQVVKKLSSNSWYEILEEIRRQWQQAKVQTGEMVGPLAAESVGEPATQLTLNTFHFCGQKLTSVTQGVPRLKELLDAQAKNKTPVTIIALKSPFCDQKAYVEALAPTLNETYLRDLLQTHEVIHDRDPFVSSSQPKDGTDQMLLDIYRLHNAYQPQGIKNASEYVIRFVLDRTKLLRLNLTIKTVQQIIRQTLSNGSVYHMLVAEQFMPELVIRIRMVHLDHGKADKLEIQKNMAHLFCKHLCNNIFICGLPSMHDAEVVPQTRYIDGKEVKQFTIQILGQNVREVWKLDVCDWKRTWTTNVVEMRNILGIEAAAHVLFDQITQVMSCDGTTISPRHILCITQVMTRGGFLTSLSRHGLNKLKTGPLVKCTFEETVEVLFDAAFFTEENKICSIADSIMIGDYPRAGTGMVHLLTDDKAIQKHVPKKPIKGIEIIRTYYSKFADSDGTDSNELYQDIAPFQSSTELEIFRPTSPIYEPKSPVYQPDSIESLHSSGPTSPRNSYPTKMPCEFMEEPEPRSCQGIYIPSSPTISGVDFPSSPKFLG